MELYYSHPVQVRFWDTGEKRYYYGIGLHDFIICGHCGKICSIKEIIEEAEKYDELDEDKAIIELSWNDLERAISAV